MNAIEQARREKLRARNFVHGYGSRENRAPEYKIWIAMIRRCEYRRGKHYPRYGGRGIIVCPRWRNDFPVFLADMGPRPSPKHSIERIDNDGNYEPGNCRWATNAEQSRNRRSNRVLTVGGESLCVTEWAKRTGIRPSTLFRRLNAGWPDELVVTLPVKAGPSLAQRLRSAS